MNLIAQINSHEWLFLDKLIEENDLQLVLFVAEAKTDQDTEGDLKDILEFAPSTKINPIISDENCKRYKITFENYLIYSVANESFVDWDENENFEGNLFRKYSKSKFLDYIQRAVNVEYAQILMDEGEYHHFCICCSNQIIDVASPAQPIIEELS
ncbi:MAG: hypothetical protein R2681_02855 [Pyrinomonadaceae bacterium]